MEHIYRHVKLTRGYGTFARENTYRVDIEIDVDSIAEVLGQKAIRNKSRTTRLLNGRIKVSVPGQMSE